MAPLRSVYRENAFLIVHETPESVALAHYLNSLGADVVLFSLTKPSKTMIYEAEDLRLTHEALKRLNQSDNDNFERAIEAEKEKILREEYLIRAELSDPFEEYETAESDFSDISMSSDEDVDGSDAEREREDRYRTARRKKHVHRTKKFKQRRVKASRGLKSTWLGKNIPSVQGAGTVVAKLVGTNDKYAEKRFVGGRQLLVLSEREREEKQAGLFVCRTLTNILACTMRFFRNSTFHAIREKELDAGKFKLKQVAWSSNTTSRSLWAGFPFVVVSSVAELKLAIEDHPISMVYVAVPYSSAILLRKYRVLLNQVRSVLGHRMNYVSLQPSFKIWKYFPEASLLTEIRHGFYPRLSLSLSAKQVEQADIKKTDALPPESHIIARLKYQAEHLKKAQAKEESLRKKAKRKRRKKKQKDAKGVLSDDEAEGKSSKEDKDAKKRKNLGEPSSKTPAAKGGESTKAAAKEEEKHGKKEEEEELLDPDCEGGRRVWFSYTAPQKGQVDNHERYIQLKHHQLQTFNRKHFVTANARDIIRWQIVSAYKDYIRRNPNSDHTTFFGSLGHSMQRNNLARMGASKDNKRAHNLMKGQAVHHRRHYAWFSPTFEGKIVAHFAAPLAEYRHGVIHYRHRLPTSNWDFLIALILATVLALKLNAYKPLRMDERKSREVLNVAGSAACEILEVCGYQTMSGLMWLFLDGGAFAIVIVQWCLFYYYGDLLVPYLSQRFTTPWSGAEDLCFYLDDFIKRGDEQGRKCHAIRALQSREAGMHHDLSPENVPLYECYMKTLM